MNYTEFKKKYRTCKTTLDDGECFVVSEYGEIIIVDTEWYDFEIGGILSLHKGSQPLYNYKQAVFIHINTILHHKHIKLQSHIVKKLKVERYDIMQHFPEVIL